MLRRRVLSPALVAPARRAKRAQLFQYSGSSADASTGVRAQASAASAAALSGASPAASNGGTPSKGKGKGKAKGKGRAGAAPAPATADAVAGVSQGAAPPRGGGDGEDEDDEEGGPPAGHAMLKSRLTSVSLRGLVQVDDKAVAVSGSLSWGRGLAAALSVVFCARSRKLSTPVPAVAETKLSVVLVEIRT